MIKRILIVLFIFMVIALASLWLITGGVGKISNAARSLGNPLSLIVGNGTDTGYSIHLPWQPTNLDLGTDISQYSDGQGQTDTQTVDQIQSQTDDIQKQINDVKKFGTPSPYKGEVTLSDRETPDGSTPLNEYIVLSASSDNTAPILLSGWSLQSVLTGKRVALPRASSLFILGVVNPITSVSLNPGQSAIVSTGASPVGVSFRENVCSGYLAQFQTFTPDLTNECPDPSGALPQIPENLQRYGASCFTYVQSLPSCRFPGSILPSDLSAACKAFITNTFTYNGCVNMYQYRTDFKKDSWRLYLGVTVPLWNNAHDIIRLLDGEGRTVDVLSY